MRKEEDGFGEWEGEEDDAIDWYDVEDDIPWEAAEDPVWQPPEPGADMDRAPCPEPGPRCTCRRQGIRTVDLLVVLLLTVLLLEDRYALRYIASGSMKPALSVGALVLVDLNAYEAALPEAGEIAVYRAESGREICHRVTGCSAEGIVFRGDNNESEDALAVAPEQLIGRVIFSTNLVSPLIRLLRGLDA